MEVDREVGDVMYSLRISGCGKDLRADSRCRFKDDRDLVLARIVEGYLNLGQADKAQQAMARAGERVASNATMLMLSARIAAAQDDRARARRLLDQAVAADRTNPTVYVARADFNQVDPQLQRDVEADLVEALVMRWLQMRARATRTRPSASARPCPIPSRWYDGPLIRLDESGREAAVVVEERFVCVPTTFSG